MNTPELLPCPFCGSDNVSEAEGTTGDGKPWYYIECLDCSACAEPEHWNRRTYGEACRAHEHPPSRHCECTNCREYFAPEACRGATLSAEQREDIHDLMYNTHGYAGEGSAELIDLTIDATLDAALYAPTPEQPTGEQTLTEERIHEIASACGICCEWDMGAASAVYSPGCEGVTRSDFVSFARAILAARGEKA